MDWKFHMLIQKKLKNKLYYTKENNILHNIHKDQLR